MHISVKTVHKSFLKKSVALMNNILSVVYYLKYILSIF